MSTRAGRNFSTTEAFVVRWAVTEAVLNSVSPDRPGCSRPDASSPAGRRIWSARCKSNAPALSMNPATCSAASRPTFSAG